MSDAVKAEVRAVQELKRSVSRYADDLRQVGQAARREMATAQQRAQEVADLRRSDAQRAMRDLQQANTDLTSATEDRRAACRHAAVAAEQRCVHAKRELDRARRATEMLAAAASELFRSMQSAEAVVSEQGSAAASVLASLEGKLAEITRGGLGSLARSALMSLGVAAEMSVAGMDVARQLGNASQGALPTSDRVTSTTQAADLMTTERQQLWAEAELERRRRDESGGHGPSS